MTAATTLPVTGLHRHEAVRLSPDAPPRIACFTLDFECDYGVRTGQFRILRHTAEMEALRAFFVRERIPLSVFVVTGVLDRWPGAFAAARLLGDDWHSHSHEHRVDGAGAANEAAASRAAFARHFGWEPAGYRAPMGLLHPDDVPVLAAAGFKFSASVFPTYRPGAYVHWSAPLEPIRYANGLVEVPFGVVRGVRLPLAVSYVKLLGPPLAMGLLRVLGGPRVLVANFHLHDVIVDEESLAQLTPAVRAAYSVRKHEGRVVLAAMARHLRDSGYSFLSMSALYDLCTPSTPGGGSP